MEPLLARLVRLASVNEKYNIFTSIRPVSKLKKQLATENPNLALSNTLCGIKDNIATTQEPTTCSSKILNDYKSPFNATVCNLLEKNGATIVGKTNLDEFGMGSVNSHSHFGQTFNPLYDTDRQSPILKEEDKYVPGGSSGGSAASVASGICDFSLGTDTGGSVRLPASYCGIYGFKPSYGRISRWGVIAYAQSLDTVGILGKDVEIVEKVYNILNKYDDKDPTCLNEEKRQLINNQKINNRVINIGISKSYLAKGINFNILKDFSKICEKLFKLPKVNLIPFDLPSLSSISPAYFTIAYSEAASNLARYDGVRYGYAVDDDSVTDYKSFISSTRESGFGNEVKKRILIGNYNLSSNIFHDNYLKAISLRRKLINEFDEIFKFPNILTNNSTGTVDFIIAPTSTTNAMKVSDYKDLEKKDPISTYVNDSFLIPSSMAGLPTMSVPVKFEGKYPTGIQIIGQYGDDERVLDFAKIVNSL